MVAALLVASMLVAGLAEMTRRYAMTTARIKAVAVEAQTLTVVRSLMSDLERIDPGSLVVNNDRLEGRVGDETVVGRIVRSSDGTILSWASPRQRRDIVIPTGVRFARAGLAVVLGARDVLPMASIEPARDTAFDCQFDTVARKCR